MDKAFVGRKVQLQVHVRISRGDGSRSFIAELNAEDSAEKLTVGDLKDILCKPPHSICTEGALSLVLKGVLLKDDTALADLPLATGSFVTAVILSRSSSSSLKSDHLRLHSSERAPLAVGSNDAVDARTAVPGGSVAASSASSPTASQVGSGAGFSKFVVELSSMRQASPASTVEPFDARAGYDFCRKTLSSECSIEDVHAKHQFCVGRQELDELKFLDWVQIEHFYRNSVSDDGSFDFYDLPCGASNLHIKFFAYFDEYCLHIMVTATGVRWVDGVSLKLKSMIQKDARIIEFIYDEFRAKRRCIQNLDTQWLNGSEGLMEGAAAGQSSQAPHAKFSICLYWPPGIVKRNKGQLLSIAPQNLTLCDAILIAQSVAQIIPPEARDQLKRWREVQQFYRSHVAGDGTFNASLLPSGTSEIDLKFFAAFEHVFWPGSKSRVGLNLSPEMRGVMNCMEVVDLLVIQIAQNPSIFSDFRCQRCFISGLKNATWLNGAEGLPENTTHDSSSIAELSLYWPPDAVKRNGGKKAKMSADNVNWDYDYVFERHPERLKSAFDHIVANLKASDPICHIFVSLIDFSRVPDWYRTATFCRLRETMPQHMETELSRVLSLPQVQARLSSAECERCFEKGAINEPEVVLGIFFRCFMDFHPELQHELERAISLLSEFDADTCVKSLMRALNLMSASDTHLIDKFEHPFFSDPKGTLMSDLGRLKHQFGSVVVDNWKRYVNSFDDEKFDCSQTKKSVNRALELFLFLICQDRHEILRLFSTRQFLVGVFEQSGGNHLRHLISVCAWKCKQDLQGKDSAVDWAKFRPAFHDSLLYPALPRTILVLLHRAFHAHRSRCGCMGGSLFPCDWPPHIKTYLLSFQFFRNLENDSRLRRILCHRDVFLELKPRIFDKPIESIVLIKFAVKLCISNLSVSCFDNVVEGPLLHAIQEDLKKEALGRAILAVDADAASLIASFFQAEELDCIWRYTHIRHDEMTSMPVRISGMQTHTWMNGAQGTSDLIPDANGCVLVRVQLPLDVVASCKGFARVAPSKVEIAGMDVSATVFVDIYRDQKFVSDNWDSLLEGFCKILCVFIERMVGADAKAAPFLTMFRFILEEIQKIVPFFSTIKEFFSKAIPGIHFFFRLLNPLTRQRALQILFTQLQVLASTMSTTLLPAVPALLDLLKKYLESERAQEVIPNLQEFSKHLAKLAGVSSFEEFLDLAHSFGPRQSSNSQHFRVSNFLSEFAMPDGKMENVSSILKEAFPEHSSVVAHFESGGIFSTFGDEKMRGQYQEMLQSGMSPSIAKMACLEQATMAAGPLNLMKALKDLEKFKTMVPLPPCVKDIEDLEKKMLRETFGQTADSFGRKPSYGHEDCATDIIDDWELAPEQRVRVKKDLPDCVPAFLAGAEGVIHKCPDASRESYGVLVQKPASAVLKCNDGGLQYIEKEHLMILGKHLPKINFATDWIDEQDCLQNKLVSYCDTCPKSHPLHFGAKPLDLDERINFCIICEDDLCSASRFTCGFGCAYSVCEQCHGLLQNPAVGSSQGSNNDEFAYVHGIKVSALQKFKERWQHTYKSLTTEQFCQMVIKPRTSIHKTSYLNCLLQQSSTADHVGNANWFISHSWKAAIGDTIDSVLDFFHSQPLQSSDAVVWFDIFCDCQHPTDGESKPSSWYMTTFRSAIANMGNLLLSIDDWKDPKPLERAWCILELHAISTKISDGGGRFEITMPAHSRESLLKETSVDASKYFNLLSNVAAEYSVCSREADKKSIHDAIRDTIGFDALNRSIFSVICNWIIGQLQALTSEMKVTNPLGSVQRLKAMGTVLYEMGRYSEALHVFQDAAQVYACFRKAAPLSFGTDISSLDAEIDRQIIRAHVYLGQYDLAQNCYDQMVKKKSVTSNTLSSRLLGFDLSALVGDVSDSDADDFDVIGTWDHLRFYHMLLFADSDDPEFAQACNTHIGKKQMAPETVTGTDFDWGVLQNAVDDPLLYLLLKQTSFQLKINRLPAAHPWVALAMLHLAHAHFEVDQFVEALALLQNTLPFLRRLPPLHPNTILALLLLSACLMQHGDLDLATSSAEEAMAMCKTHESCRRIPVPVEIERAAEEAVAILQDEEFRLNVNSLDHANVRSSCVARYVAVMKKIGTDEARMERVIINRGRDAADRMMEKLLPNVQSKMDEECSAKGKPKFDLRLLLKPHKPKSAAKQALQERAAVARGATVRA